MTVNQAAVFFSRIGQIKSKLQTLQEVALLVDGQWARVHNTRDQGREWSDLNRLEKWLREQGISRWQVINDLEEVGLRKLGEAYYMPPE